MKVVAYEGLLEAAMGIQPHIAWLLDNIIPQTESSARLDQLQLKFSKLRGCILQMEEDATEIDVEAATVFVYTTDDGQGWDNAVEALRDALAETIVGAGEYRLETEAHLAAIRDAMKWLPTIQDAADEYREVFDALAEAEALAVLKAVCVEHERNFIGCSDCVSECTPEGCLYEDDPPHIDLDGHPLE